MRQLSSRCFIVLSGLILFFSLFIFLMNSFVYHFPGNNYFPENVVHLVLVLILINAGLYFSLGKGSKGCLIGQELLYFCFVMAIIALATNAVQLTPFAPIDHYIMSFEAAIHIPMHQMLLWTQNHPQFRLVLGIIYDSLPYQMSVIPLLVIFTCRFYLLREYYFLLLCTTLLGFGVYYFFPTTAPASVMNNALFSADQIATGEKFYQIHHHINPTTNAGGLIALPSFHAIWAILCVNLLREWFIPFILLSVINTLLIISCVLLGWHYCTDIVGSGVILLISYYFLKHCQLNASEKYL